ncbi:MAG: GDSL family lipase [Clostridia bacterium]|nr:GDSL family lipase [Clostridia bacterium]
MRIIEKIRAKQKDLNGEPSIGIAFLGDSVTQGCFEDYEVSPTEIQTVFDSEKGYHAQIKRIFNILCPSVPINIINGGISGNGAVNGLSRLERDILRFSPDLCVVCFGLNDCNLEKLNDYRNAMGEIFDRLLIEDIEVIFLTPNMMSTEVSCHIQSELCRKSAQHCVSLQNAGVLDTVLDVAKEEARKRNIPICDCYAIWKKLYESGIKTTDLLYVNHPIPPMHNIFAWELVKTMFEM